MRDLRNLRNRPFLIVNTIMRPEQSVNTAKKGWTAVTGNFTVFERVSVVDRVSDKMLRDAQVILDLTNSTIVTSRFTDVPDDEQYRHYVQKYDAECDTGIRRWIEKLSAEMARDPKFIAEMEARKAAVAAENAAAAAEAEVEAPVEAAPEAPAGGEASA